ncbi:MAG: phenylacetic acid degradation bifunctional protein PaaZ [Lewinellaceae bacterium]|nr:phenylacetic acid degradation bifunctional protein PaaZ [Lewinellaceae bacterium]
MPPQPATLQPSNLLTRNPPTCFHAKAQNYVLGTWVSGSGDGVPQYNAYTGEILSTASDAGLDYAAILEYGRQTGGSPLRRMTFPERGRMLKALAFYLLERKEKYYTVSHLTGATKADSWVDIEGGIGNLFAYSSLRRRFPDEPYFVEGETIRLSKENTFIGHHILTPKRGVAVHINAFNFPIWGMLEKIAVNLLAGVPAVVKSSEQTSFLTEAMVRDIIASGILPEGALQLLVGQGRGILDHMRSQDVVTFTGSAETGKKLRAHPALIQHSVPFTMEADSLNAAVLGEDATPGTAEFDLFIKEVRREMVTKAGQKCTAVRRIIVPEALLEAVQTALSKALGQTTVGDPSADGVRMGALINRLHLARVREKLALLAESTPIVHGNIEQFEVVGADRDRGAFLPPVLLLNARPLLQTISHETECFGPVSTLMPYKTLDEAIEIARMGKGSLVSTICTNDRRIQREYVLEAAAHHGRILMLNRNSAKESTGHGSPMPMLVHGGPGHAGGGEEMGGMRGVFHYMQRTAIQGHPTDITNVSNQYQTGAEQTETPVHPFKKHFDDLFVGETLITAKHTVSEADIHNFANVSGDNFYAHTDATALEGTPFTGRVAHGYFVLSKAAGLFVDAKKGPVLLNYGLDECRFTKPVYPGMTIGVKLTVKEKIEQEHDPAREGVGAIPRGIVKWLVDVYDETGETVAVATILTMVRKKG